ncbi:MAG TPA: hypothetical protein VNV66_05195, partial [Pilimelia sp.]|nr:hypothetical protein [Pilimelia sp.]
MFAARWPHPIAALLIGAGIGALTAAPVWVLVRAWPVIVRVWWWLPELLIAAALGWVWTQLVAHTPTALALVLVAATAAVCGLVPRVRRALVAVYHCFEVRHRLRTCFTAFIVTNRHGSLPLILWARPTPVGERVWIYLRPGLSLADLQTRLDKIAATCWATSVTAERAGANAAYIVVDIKRREALTATVASPLPGLVTVPDTPQGITTLPTAPTSPAAPGGAVGRVV